MTNTLNTNLAYDTALSVTTGINGSSYTFTDTTSVLTTRSDPAGMEIKGTLTVNGRDIEERLTNIEKVLGFPEVDSEMFIKYPSLKKKYNDYINELAKLRTWEALTK